MKVVIADPKDGKSYQIEIDDTKGKAFHGARIGEEVEGSLLGMNGYKVQITGGSDKEGFPMRRGFHGNGRKSLLISAGAGIKKPSLNKTKKTVRGETISENIHQINVKVIKYGSKNIKEELGIENKENASEGEKKEE